MCACGLACGRAGVRACGRAGVRAGGLHAGGRAFLPSVRQILEKAPQLPGDVEWHFIGHLQSNKCNALVRGVPSLAVVESIDTVKCANKLNSACDNAERTEPLGIMVQVRTTTPLDAYRPSRCRVLTRTPWPRALCRSTPLARSPRAAWSLARRLWSSRGTSPQTRAPT